MISVVMVSYLGQYPGSRANAGPKFLRAVQSFVDQELKESELIILADGCEKTQELYELYFANEPRIKLFMRPKSAGWPGEHRQFGIETAKYNWITYLDSDDMFTPDRLSNLWNATQGRQLILDSAYTAPAENSIKSRRLQASKKFQFQGIDWIQYTFPSIGGTYQICHPKNTRGVEWQTRKQRGEDSIFVKNLINAFSKDSIHRMKTPPFYVEIGGYLICHHPQWGFDV